MSRIIAILPTFNEEVAIGNVVLVNVLHDMESRRPLYYFTIPGILMSATGVGIGLEFLRTFYHGRALYYGPMLLMVLLALLGCFMALTGIILHTLSRLINEANGEFKAIRKNKA